MRRLLNCIICFFILVFVSSLSANTIFVQTPAGGAFGLSAVQETFTGANDTTPWSASWNTTTGTPEIQSNMAASDSGNSAAYHDATIADSDWEIYITVVTKSTTDSVSCGFYMIDVGAGGDGYGLYFSNKTGTDTIAIWEMDDSVETVINTVTQELTNGDSIGLQKIGSTLTAYYKPAAGSWTVVDTQVDSTFGSLNYQPFLMISGSVYRLDNMGWGAR